MLYEVITHLIWLFRGALKCDKTKRDLFGFFIDLPVKMKTAYHLFSIGAGFENFDLRLDRTALPEPKVT